MQNGSSTVTQYEIANVGRPGHRQERVLGAQAVVERTRVSLQDWVKMAKDRSELRDKHFKTLVFWPCRCVVSYTNADVSEWPAASSQKPVFVTAVAAPAAAVTTTLATCPRGLGCSVRLSIAIPATISLFRDFPQSFPDKCQCSISTVPCSPFTIHLSSNQLMLCNAAFNADAK
jgi:hypothetical protein